MKFLTVVFSFERLAYLKNCVRSIDEFFPWGDGLIVDDGTDGPRMNEYLNGLSARWKYKIFNKSGSERFSTFYRNMAYALQYSIEADYDYCLFIEDDEQFVWKKDDYPEYIESFFTVMSDAIQLSPLFSRRVVPYDNRLEYIESSKSYKTIRGFNTTAFWDIRKIRRIKDYGIIYEQCKTNLNLNSAYFLKHGMRLYYQYDPTVAVIPWVESVRENGPVHEGAEKINKKYVLNQLSVDEIFMLSHRNPQVLPYQEFFYLSDNNCNMPIWHQTTGIERYWYLCQKVLDDEGDREILNIPSVTDPAESRLNEMELSHIQFYDKYYNNNLTSKIIGKTKGILKVVFPSLYGYYIGYKDRLNDVYKPSPHSADMLNDKLQKNIMLFRQGKYSVTK